MKVFKAAFAEILRGATDGQVDNRLGDFKKIKELAEGHELVLYGCGAGGAAVLGWLDNLKVAVCGVCDSRQRGSFPAEGRHQILSPDEMRKQYPNALILISSKKYEREIAEGLLKLGYNSKQILPYPEWPSGLPPAITAENFIREHYSGYEWVYGLLEDDISRKILLNRIRMYLFGTSLCKTPSSGKYFDRDIISLIPNEVFVDGGGFSGDTVVEFIEECGTVSAGQFKCIYSFEPDSKNCEAMHIAFSSLPNVIIVQKGLWSHEAELTFQVSQTSSASSFVFDVSEDKVCLSVTALDDFFSDFPIEEWPTFIKMDIEGSEQYALRGAKYILRTKRPKLALCVYHKPDDIYMLPRIALDENPNYNFYLRQTTDGFNETVLYAVPR